MKEQSVERNEFPPDVQAQFEAALAARSNDPAWDRALAAQVIQRAEREDSRRSLRLRILTIAAGVLLTAGVAFGAFQFAGDASAPGADELANESEPALIYPENYLEAAFAEDESDALLRTAALDY